MTIKKNDFIEIEFTGKANNEIFDTTNKEEAKKIGIGVEVKPLIISVGNEMLLKGLDDFLEGKEIDKRYSVKLNPEQAFGPRNSQLIKIMPMRVFREKQINPMPGMTFQMDNYIVKILSVSGGRVIVDFNNPLAGKEIEYDIKINKIIEDIKEKINALQDFFFRQRFDFEIKDAKVIFREQKIKPFIEIFKQKFKDITGLDFEVEKQKENKKQFSEIKSNSNKEPKKKN